MDSQVLRATDGNEPFVPKHAGAEDGFTLIELISACAVLLIVMTAAWLLLSTSNENLNRIEWGGQASEANRAAFAAFEKDLYHAKLPSSGASPVLVMNTRSVTFLCDGDVIPDGVTELVTWAANDTSGTLVRAIKEPPGGATSWSTIADYNGGTTTTGTVLTGLAPASDLGTDTMFVYGASAAQPTVSSAGQVGLITFRLRNGMPKSDQNVVDRVASYRVIAFVINGYPNE